MSEPEPRRRRARRKYAAGFFEQTATVVGGAASGLFTAGVAAPLVAAALGEVSISPSALALIVGSAFGGASVLWAISARLRGSAKRLDDDGSNWPPVAPPPAKTYVTGQAREDEP